MKGVIYASVLSILEELQTCQKDFKRLNIPAHQIPVKTRLAKAIDSITTEVGAVGTLIHPLPDDLFSEETIKQ